MPRAALTRVLTVAIALALMTGLFSVTASAASATPIRPSAESLMVARINNTRAAYGLPALRENLQMVRLGREWSRAMALQRRVYHRPNLADVVDGDYVRLAENVGFTHLAGANDTTLVDRLHRAFLLSEGHRRQILGRFNQVGVGIYRTSSGGMFVAVNFIKGPLDGFPLYRDFSDSPHRRPIARLFRKGAVKGCSRNRFCPRATGTRSYLAATIDRAAKISAAGAYVSSTCATSFACRSAEMTRGEMAVLLAQSLRLEPVSGRQFTDVSASSRELVNAVVKAGVMSGCSATRFCPGREVSRGRIAHTVYRAVAR